jgi:hypothetical protein
MAKEVIVFCLISLKLWHLALLFNHFHKELTVTMSSMFSLMRIPPPSALEWVTAGHIYDNILFGKLIVAQLVKKFLLLYGTEG